MFNIYMCKEGKYQPPRTLRLRKCGKMTESLDSTTDLLMGKTAKSQFIANTTTGKSEQAG